MDNRFLVISPRQDYMDWLGDSLAGLGVSIWDRGRAENTLQLVSSVGPRIIFLEFDTASVVKGTELVQRILNVFPHVWIVGFSEKPTADVILAAMRAGARDFVTLFSDVKLLRASVASLLEKAQPALMEKRGEMIALLGARAGTGTTLTSIHLAMALREALPPEEEILLLDFGFPTADSALYLDLQVVYNFADAARSVRRFDHALMKTAFARHKSGLAVLPLPQNMADLREIAPADALSAVSMMKSYFRYIVADLGAMASLDFLVQVMGLSDRTLLVCEQTLPSLFSSRQLLQSIRERGPSEHSLQAIINKYEENSDFSGSQVAENLGIPLMAKLPNSSKLVLQCINSGRSILETQPKSELTRAVRKLALQVCGEQQKKPDLKAIPARPAKLAGRVPWPRLRGERA